MIEQTIQTIRLDAVATVLIIAFIGALAGIGLKILLDRYR